MARPERATASRQTGGRTRRGRTRRGRPAGPVPAEDLSGAHRAGGAGPGWADQKGEQVPGDTEGRRHPAKLDQPGALGVARWPGRHHPHGRSSAPRGGGSTQSVGGRPGHGRAQSVRSPGDGALGRSLPHGGGRHLTPAGDGRGGIVRTRTLFDQLIQVRGSRRCDRRPGRVHRPPADGRRSLAAGSLRSSGGKARARGRCREAGPRRRRSDARARGRWG